MIKKPALYCEDLPVDNLSPNKNVFFLDDNHLYYHKNDIINNTPLPFEDSKYRFKSPTGIIKDFKEEFDTVPIAKRYVIKHELDITYEELIAEWEAKGKLASDDGTMLHNFAEHLWNGWKTIPPEHEKTKHVIELVAELKEKYTLVKTELLVYSLVLRLAGQVDLLVKNDEGLHILDYKFIKAPLEKKSFYNPRTKKYKMMFGPFRFLYDTAFFHYSIQMELYRYLMGTAGKKVKSKSLLVVTPEEYNIVPGYDIKIWVDKTGTIQARYKHPYLKKLYDSSKDPVYLRNKVKVI